MADLHTQVTAPNGREYNQPIGLFINNEFVKSESGEKDHLYQFNVRVDYLFALRCILTLTDIMPVEETRARSSLYMPPGQMMLTWR